MRQTQFRIDLHGAGGESHRVNNAIDRGAPRRREPPPDIRTESDGGHSRIRLVPGPSGAQKPSLRVAKLLRPRSMPDKKAGTLGMYVGSWYHSARR